MVRRILFLVFALVTYMAADATGGLLTLELSLIHI